MSTGRQPDILTIGHTGRLVSLEALADELRVPVTAARTFVANLKVPLVRIGSKDYLSLITLEIELFSVTRHPRFPLPESLEDMTRAIQHIGYIYAGLTRESIRRRLGRVIAPLKPPRYGGKPPRGSHHLKGSTQPKGTKPTDDTKDASQPSPK